jgi:hypothetical protein
MTAIVAFLGIGFKKFSLAIFFTAVTLLDQNSVPNGIEKYQQML